MTFGTGQRSEAWWRFVAKPALLGQIMSLSTRELAARNPMFQLQTDLIIVRLIKYFLTLSSLVFTPIRITKEGAPLPATEASFPLGEATTHENSSLQANLLLLAVTF